MAYLLTELALKIPQDILYYKVQMYLSSPTAEIIKEIFNTPAPISFNLFCGSKLARTKRMKLIIKLRINNKLYARNKNNLNNEILQQILPRSYALFIYDLPNITWTRRQLYMLPVGLLPNVRKSWCKRQLLQALYPNLQFNQGENQGSPIPPPIIH